MRASLCWSYLIARERFWSTGKPRWSRVPPRASSGSRLAMTDAPIVPRPDQAISAGIERLAALRPGALPYATAGRYGDAQGVTPLPHELTRMRHLFLKFRIIGGDPKAVRRFGEEDGVTLSNAQT